jgi:hypothetical protein
VQTRQAGQVLHARVPDRAELQLEVFKLFQLRKVLHAGVAHPVEGQDQFRQPGQPAEVFQPGGGHLGP